MNNKSNKNFHNQNQNKQNGGIMPKMIHCWRKRGGKGLELVLFALWILQCCYLCTQLEKNIVNVVEESSSIMPTTRESDRESDSSNTSSWGWGWVSNNNASTTTSTSTSTSGNNIRTTSTSPSTAVIGSKGDDSSSNSSNVDNNHHNASTTTSSSSNNNKIPTTTSPNNNIISSEKKNQQCWRQCPRNRKRRNKIIYTYNAKAGWNDRLIVISELITWAGYLCADLYIPSPQHLLGIWHNDNKELDPDLHWEDMFSFSWVEGYYNQDNNEQQLSQPLHEINNDFIPKDAFIYPHGIDANKTWAIKAVLLGSSDGSAGDGDIMEDNTTMPTTTSTSSSSSPSSSVIYIETKDEDDPMDQLRLLEYYTSVQQQNQNQQEKDDDDEIFIWNIQTDFWRLYDENFMMRRNRLVINSNCDYYINNQVNGFYNYWKYEPSIHITAIANSIWSELIQVYNVKPLPYMLPLEPRNIWPDKWVLPKFSSWLKSVDEGRGSAVSTTNTIGLLHIRRGDTKDRCDTSIPKMEEFINCTFYGSNVFGKNITVLVGSDETDEEYLNSINQMIEQFQHITAINFDKLIWNHLYEYATTTKMPQLLNNFVVFAIQNLIRPTLHFEIQRKTTGWSRCMDCESNLLESYLKHEYKFDKPRIYYNSQNSHHLSS